MKKDRGLSSEHVEYEVAEISRWRLFGWQLVRWGVDYRLEIETWKSSRF